MSIRTVLCAALPLLLQFGTHYDAHALDQGLPSARPVPTHWVSIGPRRVTSPAVPALGLGQYDAVGRLGAIAVDPTDSQVIYVASAGELGHEGSGVWKTTNGGNSWAPIADKLPRPTLAVAAIALDPTDHARVFIVTADLGLFRSDDAGLNWISVTTDIETYVQGLMP
jgi:hypothetical protein